jgi:DNA-binding transcriptional ArsR family regulator
MVNELKVLSSDTRIKILDELKERPTTASFLSKSLNKHITTISEHLEKLESVGLVEHEKKPGGKFVFYRLTDNGRRIVAPTLTIKTILSGVVISIILISYVGFLYLSQTRMLAETAPLKSPVGGVEKYVAPSSSFNLFLLYMIPIFIGLFILGIIFGRKLVKRRLPEY